MNCSRLITVFLLVITLSGCSESAEPNCFDYDIELAHRLEGEAFYFLPYLLMPGEVSGENFTWYKNSTEAKEISNNKEERVHHQGGSLFILNLHIEDSGFYVAWRKTQSGCSRFHLNLRVFNESHTNKELLYVSVTESYQNIKIPCPDPVSETCEHFSGKLSWEKDSKPLPEQHKDSFWVRDADKSKEGIYTCICTWQYNQRMYKSSGSRKLKVKAKVIHKQPTILSPANKEQFADAGREIKLHCSGSCGINVGPHCHARWLIDGKPISKTGYSIINKTDGPTEETTATAILTIRKVSAKDFQATFTCHVRGLSQTTNTTLTLKPRASIVPLITGGMCVMVFCALVAVLVKFFAIDLALFFRPYLPIGRNNKDGRVFDAYVVYQMQNMDKATEDALCVFITKNLPSVLEEKCGYRLFIHGRDDIPGEDRLELVEDRMKQSRRLMVILTPGSGSKSSPAPPQDSLIGGFDWQVGLHHALVQREMTVILIQIGDTGPQGYKHLPPGLQHLIHKSAPIRWPEDLHGASAHNSRFWKRVRYLMPATPANKHSHSVII